MSFSMSFQPLFLKYQFIKNCDTSGAVAIATSCCRHLQAAAEVKKGKVADAKVWAKVFKNGGVGGNVDFWKAVCSKTQAPLGLGDGQNQRLLFESFSFLGDVHK